MSRSVTSPSRKLRVTSSPVSSTLEPEVPDINPRPDVVRYGERIDDAEDPPAICCEVVLGESPTASWRGISSGMRGRRP